MGWSSCCEGKAGQESNATCKGVRETGGAGSSDVAPTGGFASAANHQVISVQGVHALEASFAELSLSICTRCYHYILCLHFHRSFKAVQCSWAEGYSETLCRSLALCLEESVTSCRREGCNRMKFLHPELTEKERMDNNKGISAAF